MQNHVHIVPIPKMFIIPDWSILICRYSYPILLHIIYLIINTKKFFIIKARPSLLQYMPKDVIP